MTEREIIEAKLGAGEEVSPAEFVAFIEALVAPVVQRVPIIVSTDTTGAALSRLAGDE